MSNKKEPLKDLFYNAFDYIVMLAIILIVVAIIAWRLDMLFADTNISKANGDKETIETDRADDAETKKKVKSLSEQIDKNKSENKDKEKSDTKNSKDKKDNKGKKEKKSSSIIPIEIPEGSHSTAIAEILKSKGIIDENDEFISKVEDMDVSTKLRSGYFEVTEDDSLEDVINIIIK